MRLTESAHYTVRLMQVDDIPQASEIDKECFTTLWPPTPFKRDLSNPLARYLVAVEKNSQNNFPEPPPSRQGTQAPSLRKRLIAAIQRLLRRGKPPLESPAEARERIAGFLGLWFMADEAHITTLGVREAYRRQGIGELLLLSAIDMAVARDAAVVTLEVRPSNPAAQALYEKCAFRRAGVRRRYYTDNGEDAVIMTTERITSAPFQQHLERLKRAYQERWGVALGPSQ